MQVEQKQPMSVRRKVGTPLCVLCILMPVFLIYMTHRMSKVRKALVVIAIVYAVSVGLEMLFPWPYGLISDLAFSLSFMSYIVNKWSKVWNRSIDDQNKPAGTM